jgi:hypothetical protein
MKMVPTCHYATELGSGWVGSLDRQFGGASFPSLGWLHIDPRVASSQPHGVGQNPREVDAGIRVRNEDVRPAVVLNHLRWLHSSHCF